MLVTLIVILLLLWAVGQFGPWPTYRDGGLLHVLLVIVVVIVVLRLVGVGI